MAERFSLKDHLFNAETVGRLAAEYAAVLPDLDAVRFREEVLEGFSDRELMARLDWIADCLEPYLSPDFNGMARELEAAMPPPLDPGQSDNDFGHFIHAVPGILAVRHGLEQHRERAMALLHEATKRFSMEFYIRPFLNRWPEETLAELAFWARDPNYHVRRLVSEGTRPRLPWARAVHLEPEQTLPLLDVLHTDPARYVTRSVANHLNDLTKSSPALVLERLSRWRGSAPDVPCELEWITSHALRTLVKSGDRAALNLLGYRDDVALSVALDVPTQARIGGTLAFSCRITAPQKTPLLLDYRLEYTRPNGLQGAKVFKLRKGSAAPTAPFIVKKDHGFKAAASTFTWRPGLHRLILQVNGVDRAAATFELLPETCDISP